MPGRKPEQTAGGPSPSARPATTTRRVAYGLRGPRGVWAAFVVLVAMPFVLPLIDGVQQLFGDAMPVHAGITKTDAFARDSFLPSYPPRNSCKAAHPSVPLHPHTGTRPQFPLTDAGALRHMLRDVVLVVFMSPPRYHLVRLVYEHYAPFFSHIHFTGPRALVHDGLVVEKEWIGVKGRFQHHASYRTLRKLLAGRLWTYRGFDNRTRLPVREELREPAAVAGYLQVSDDLVLQPWALAGLDLGKVWVTKMGVDDVFRPGIVLDGTGADRVPVVWEWWTRYRPLLAHAYPRLSLEFRKGLTRAAQATPLANFAASGVNVSQWDADYRPEHIGFFGVADLFYIPVCHAAAAAGRLREMVRHHVMNELAVPTALRSLEAAPEILDVQYYWETGVDPNQCARTFWHPWVVGFHRCTHQHPFAKALFNPSDLRNLINNTAYRLRMLKVPL